MNRKGWYNEPGRHSLASRGIKSRIEEHGKFAPMAAIADLQWRDSEYHTAIYTVGDVSKEAIQKARQTYQNKFTEGQKENIGYIALDKDLPDDSSRGEYKNGTINIYDVDGMHDRELEWEPIEKTILHEVAHDTLHRMRAKIINLVYDEAGYHAEPVSDLINNPDKFKGTGVAEVFDIFADFGEYLHEKVAVQEFMVGRERVPEDISDVDKQDVAENFADWWTKYKFYPEDEAQADLDPDGMELMRKIERWDNEQAG